jgi:hypothetical protein
MREFDPLFKVKLAYNNNIINKQIYDLLSKRKTLVDEKIEKINKLTEIEYPPYFIEPSLLIATSSLEYEQFSIIYARTLPISNKNNKIEIFIQLFAPLIIYGLKGTIYSVLAHEFLHYLNIINKIINLEVYSDKPSDTLFENTYSDSEKLFDHHKVFKRDKYLIKTIDSKFEFGFSDEKLNRKSIKYWLQKKLPMEKLQIENNYTNLSFLSMANTEIGEDIKRKIIKYL